MPTHLHEQKTYVEKMEYILATRSEEYLAVGMKCGQDRMRRMKAGRGVISQWMKKRIDKLYDENKILEEIRGSPINEICLPLAERQKNYDDEKMERHETPHHVPSSMRSTGWGLRVGDTDRW